MLRKLNVARKKRVILDDNDHRRKIWSKEPHGVCAHVERKTRFHHYSTRTKEQWPAF